MNGKFKDIDALMGERRRPPTLAELDRTAGVSPYPAAGTTREGTAMQRKKASDFDQRILELYDGYVHGRMSKRDFLDHAAKYTVGGLTAAAVLEASSPTTPWRAQVRAGRSGDHTECAEYDSPEGTGTISGLIARPADATVRCRRSWWCTKTAASTPTSRTWRGAWARPASSRSHRMA